MATPRTHARIDRDLCGTPVELSPGGATVELRTSDEMAVDGHGLVHGGFVFGLADHAAMLAVDEPTVVLASAECEFFAPVTAGELLVARAAVDGKGEGHEGRRSVHCIVRRGDESVFEGIFRCVVPRRHVLAQEGGR